MADEVPRHVWAALARRGSCHCCLGADQCLEGNNVTVVFATVWMGELPQRERNDVPF
jgi:hypothetical protein